MQVHCPKVFSHRSGASRSPLPESPPHWYNPGSRSLKYSRLPKMPPVQTAASRSRPPAGPIRPPVPPPHLSAFQKVHPALICLSHLPRSQNQPHSLQLSLSFPGKSLPHPPSPQNTPENPGPPRSHSGSLLIPETHIQEQVFCFRLPAPCRFSPGFLKNDPPAPYR